MLICRGQLYAILAVLVISLHSTVSHEWGSGVCPSTVPFMKNFDITQFSGNWYVRRKTGTYSSCLRNRYFFTKGEWRILESRDWLPLDAVGIDSNLEHEGYLSVPDVAPARMRVKFRLNVAGKADYIILDTDYKNYAVVYECQNIVNILGLAVSRRSGAVLTRELDWNDTEIMDKAVAELRDLGVETDVVSHEGCNKPSLQVTVDKDLVENVSNAFGEAIGAARDTVEGVIKTGIDVFSDSTTTAKSQPKESNSVPVENEHAEVIDLRGATDASTKEKRVPSEKEKVVVQSRPTDP